VGDAGRGDRAVDPAKAAGHLFLSFFEPRRRSEQAIVAVVLEAYVNGVSTRNVDRLVEQLEIEGMTKDRVSAICRALDEQGELSRRRPLEGAYPYLWLDVKQVKARHQGRVVSKALLIAYAVHETGLREGDRLGRRALVRWRADATIGLSRSTAGRPIRLRRSLPQASLSSRDGRSCSNARSTSQSLTGTSSHSPARPEGQMLTHDRTMFTPRLWPERIFEDLARRDVQHAGERGESPSATLPMRAGRGSWQAADPATLRSCSQGLAPRREPQ
jgi:hypothetical protein